LGQVLLPDRVIQILTEGIADVSYIKGIVASHFQSRPGTRERTSYIGSSIPAIAGLMRKGAHVQGVRPKVIVKRLDKLGLEIGHKCMVLSAPHPPAWVEMIPSVSLVTIRAAAILA
jgi:hypothetical protein